MYTILNLPCKIIFTTYVQIKIIFLDYLHHISDFLLNDSWVRVFDVHYRLSCPDMSENFHSGHSTYKTTPDTFFRTLPEQIHSRNSPDKVTPEIPRTKSLRKFPGQDGFGHALTSLNITRRNVSEIQTLTAFHLCTIGALCDLALQFWNTYA